MAHGRSLPAASKRKPQTGMTQPTSRGKEKKINRVLPEDYAELLEDLKLRVRSAQIKAATAVNRELIALYFYIGRQLAERSQSSVWGDKTVERLAADLRSSFPNMSGFSRSNLFSMRQVYLAWVDAPETVQQLVGQIPWGHHLVLLGKLKNSNARTWYLSQAVAYGWSRAVLILQIEGRLFERQGKALTNFSHTLPPPQSDLARGVLKDPYLLDFLSLGPDVREREIEQSLVSHVQRFLLELGVGFSFVGRQVPLEVGGETFYVDLLFYHLRLRCYVVVELKASSFQPEFVGKMSFYLSAVDAILRHPDDQPSIGLLLCKAKNEVIVEYALRDLRKPIGVAQWETQLVASLPEEFHGNLPSISDLEAELSVPIAPLR